MNTKSLLTFLSLTLCSASSARAAEFVPLEFGVWGNIYIESLNVSEDGSVVAGYSTENVIYRWTRQSGLETLLENGMSASMSGDGRTIVSSRLAAGVNTWEPIKITDEGIDVLPVPAGFDSVFAGLISQDGSTVFGNARRPGDNRLYGIRWTDEGVSEFPSGIPFATSATGGVAVGQHEFSDGYSAYQWTGESGIQRMPSLPSRDYEGAFGVSSDGRWTVGRARDLSGTHRALAVRWDGLSPPEPLPHDNPAWGTAALDVTADGSCIVGRLYPNVGDTNRAGIWTEETGMVVLQDVLVNDYRLGEALDGWTLDGVYDITDDGRFLVGSATNPDGLREAFLVDLHTLVGDVNLDGEVNGLDVDPFVDVLLSGPYQPEADMNGDDVVNGLDVDLFVDTVIGVGGADVVDAGTSVPESSTLALTALGSLGLLGYGWRQRRYARN